jgi:hypothetical protein
MRGNINERDIILCVKWLYICNCCLIVLVVVSTCWVSVGLVVIVRSWGGTGFIHRCFIGGSVLRHNKTPLCVFVELWLPLCTHVVAQVGMCGIKLFFPFSMSIIVLWYSNLFIIIFIVSLLIIFKMQFNLLSTCSIVAVSRCMFLIPGTNIGGGAGSYLSCLVLALGLCASQSFELINDCYLRWVIVCFLQLIVFNCWHFYGSGACSFLASSADCLPG